MEEVVTSQNWAMVRNQLLMDDGMSQLMQQYDVAY